ncbi:MAG: response regulator [Verrucomicrobiota bacterium]|nr:response regulator [Verrucomicrobiota bacterium]
MKKLLIIEDDQVVANIYRHKFAVEGYQVDVALDGLAGLEKVRLFRPDVVILDLLLPGVSGVEVLKQLRAETEYAKLPVVVFSNTYLSSIMQEAWKAGATLCLSKANCSPRQLIDGVRNALFPNDASATLFAPPTAAAGAIVSSPLTAESPAAETHPETRDRDAAFQADLRNSFITSFPATLATLRSLLRELNQAGDETARLKPLGELYRRIHALTGNAGIAGVPHVARLSDALEALLKELCETPRNINASTLRTVALAVDGLAPLGEQSVPPNQPQTSAPRVLVVGHETLSRRALVYALEKAKLDSVNIDDSIAAYELLVGNSFDLIFLDVDLPGLNGFELSARLRALPAHQATPVVLVTSLSDFENHANASQNGGNDFIGKPFLFIEVVVKALAHVLRGPLFAVQ